MTMSPTRRTWPPASPHGRTLVTTRRRDAALTGDGRRLVEVGLFSRAEAVASLGGVLASHGRAEPSSQLAARADDLGCLLLALSQAAAYLADAHLTCADYRGLLADRATSLADAAPDALPDDQNITVAAAWSLSIDRADALRPAGLARPMLHLASFLDANGIPETVLTSEPARCTAVQAQAVALHLTVARSKTGTRPVRCGPCTNSTSSTTPLTSLTRASGSTSSSSALHAKP
ncbi:hypothetical protein ACWDCC_35415 [Streptomyces sp. NPDC001102]